jgi:hypothetical protein
MSKSQAIANNEATIWKRIMEPEKGAFPPEVAESILRLDFAERDRERMHELAAKARDGSLTPEERQEIDSYERVGGFLSLLKVKARRSLQNSSNA